MNQKKSDDYHAGYSDGIKAAEKDHEKNGLFFEKLHSLINDDISRIYWEQEGQDGMYGMFPEDYGKLDGLHNGMGVMERIFRHTVEGFERYTTRIYVLNTSYGGICILGEKRVYSDEIYYTIFHLGEDDGYFFIHSDGNAGVGYMNKVNFIDMTSRAISLLNNNKE